MLPGPNGSGFTSSRGGGGRAVGWGLEVGGWGLGLGVGC